MSNKNRYKGTSEIDEHTRNNSFTTQQGREDQKYQMFSDPANERQRVGNSSDQNWWDSGTDQQQQFFRGDTNYPYRENYWERNQQSQGGIENLYPQEPASYQQKQNFAEGSQYPYEGGFGSGNLQAREGLERAKGWDDLAQGSRKNWKEQRRTNSPQSYDHNLNQSNQMPDWMRNEQTSLNGQDQFENINLTTNQTQNTMRPDERNFRRNYYNNDRNQDYGRDRNRLEDRDFGNRDQMEDRGYNRSYGGGGYRSERDTYRGYDRDSDYSRDRLQSRGNHYNQDSESQEYRGHNQGQYHSTRTENPGRGYDTEQEMNRHSNTYYGGPERDRSYNERDRNYRGDRYYYEGRSSHRSTGPYNDYERDLDRYGVREDYQDRNGSYNRSDRDRRLDRGPSGSWGRSNYDTNDRYERDRGRY